MSDDGNTTAVIPDEATPPAVRPAMVATAVQFFNNPKLQGTSVARQHAFLLEKGLTPAEISAATTVVERARQAAPSPQAIEPRAAGVVSWLGFLLKLGVGAGALFAGARALQVPWDAFLLLLFKVLSFS